MRSSPASWPGSTSPCTRARPVRCRGRRATPCTSTAARASTGSRSRVPRANGHRRRRLGFIVETRAPSTGPLDRRGRTAHERCARVAARTRSRASGRRYLDHGRRNLRERHRGGRVQHLGRSRSRRSSCSRAARGSGCAVSTSRTRSAPTTSSSRGSRRSARRSATFVGGLLRLLRAADRRAHRRRPRRVARSVRGARRHASRAVRVREPPCARRARRNPHARDDGDRPARRARSGRGGVGRRRGAPCSS